MCNFSKMSYFNFFEFSIEIHSKLDMTFWNRTKKFSEDSKAKSPLHILFLIITTLLLNTI